MLRTRDYDGGEKKIERLFVVMILFSGRDDEYSGVLSVYRRSRRFLK